MSISQHRTASGRPLRVAPAWVGAARPADRVGGRQMPVREAVWIWSVRRYARIALWGLPVAALLYGWTTLGVRSPPGPLAIRLAAGWLATVAMVALAGLLAGSRTRRLAVAGLLVGLAGMTMLLPTIALPAGSGLVDSPDAAAQLRLVAMAAAAVTGAGWLLLGWAVFRCRLVNPADGILLMVAAVVVGAGPSAIRPLPVVGALLLLIAGMGLAWTGNRFLPPA